MNDAIVKLGQHVKRVFATFVVLIAMFDLAHAQVFTRLASFYGADGQEPLGVTLTQGLGGNLYGTTPAGGGANGEGTVFRLMNQGRVKTLYVFCNQQTCSDGAFPYAGLILSTDGTLYGTIDIGGAFGFGTVFAITPAGNFVNLYSFRNDGDGEYPVATVTEGVDGMLYGTTSGCDAETCTGTVFKMTPSGVLSTLYSFADNEGGLFAGLIQGSDGNLYGGTILGGKYGQGTVFRITPTGKLNTLHSFTGTDGEGLAGSLVEGSDGSLYGITSSGGAQNSGTVFKISASGTFATLHDFCSQRNCTDGEYSYGSLVEGTDGNFYGTTRLGGANGVGTIFQITPEGVFTTLHSFDNEDGSNPHGSLVQATDGIFYGTTEWGGNFGCDKQVGCGTIFSLDMGLSPFVSFLRGAGMVGRHFGILGQGFAGTTNVSINGTAATFTVTSDTFIKATVPPGATTGYVTVTTPTGTLRSNKKFVVLQSGD